MAWLVVHHGDVRQPGGSEDPLQILGCEPSGGSVDPSPLGLVLRRIVVRPIIEFDPEAANALGRERHRMVVHSVDMCPDEVSIRRRGDRSDQFRWIGHAVENAGAIDQVEPALVVL